MAHTLTDHSVTGDVNSLKLSQIKERISTYEDNLKTLQVSQETLQTLRAQEGAPPALNFTQTSVDDNIVRQQEKITKAKEDLKLFETKKRQAKRLLEQPDLEDDDTDVDVEQLRLAVSQISGTESPEKFTESISKLFNFAKTAKYSLDNLKYAFSVLFIDDAFDYYISINDKSLEDITRLLQERFGSYITVQQSLQKLDKLKRKENQTIHSFIAYAESLLQKTDFLFKPDEIVGRKIFTLDSALMSNVNPGVLKAIKTMKYRANSNGLTTPFDVLISMVSEAELQDPFHPSTDELQVHASELDRSLTDSFRRKSRDASLNARRGLSPTTQQPDGKQRSLKAPHPSQFYSDRHQSLERRSRYSPYRSPSRSPHRLADSNNPLPSADIKLPNPYVTQQQPQYRSSGNKVTFQHSSPNISRSRSVESLINDQNTPPPQHYQQQFNPTRYSNDPYQQRQQYQRPQNYNRNQNFQRPQNYTSNQNFNRNQNFQRPQNYNTNQNFSRNQPFTQNYRQNFNRGYQNQRFSQPQRSGFNSYYPPRYGSQQFFPQQQQNRFQNRYPQQNNNTEIRRFFTLLHKFAVPHCENYACRRTPPHFAHDCPHVKPFLQAFIKSNASRISTDSDNKSNRSKMKNTSNR